MTMVQVRESGAMYSCANIFLSGNKTDVLPTFARAQVASFSRAKTLTSVSLPTKKIWGRVFADIDRNIDSQYAACRGPR